MQTNINIIPFGAIIKRGGRIEREVPQHKSTEVKNDRRDQKHKRTGKTR